ncbi:MAG: hypothetical protein ACNI25_03850 [Halarcobacter sp.]
MSINDCNKLLGIYSSTKDYQQSFFDFVYEKISRDTKNRDVINNFDSIDIAPFDSLPVRVIPVNKEIDIKNLNISKEIEKAKDIILNDNFSQIYLVYPKHDNFTKHIQVKVKELDACSEEYIIKVIPYSLKSILRKKRRCNGNSNILCK